MTVEQCRAGRALLNWSAGDLATHAGIGIATAKRFESGQTVQPASVDALRSALETEGIVIIGENEASKGGGVGVRIATGSSFANKAE